MTLIQRRIVYVEVTSENHNFIIPLCLRGEVLTSLYKDRRRKTLKNEPINSATHYPHHAVWTRVGEGEGGGLVGSIYGEKAERQYCKSVGGETVQSRRFRKRESRAEKSAKEDKKERLMWTYMADVSILVGRPQISGLIVRDLGFDPLRSHFRVLKTVTRWLPCDVKVLKES